MALADGDRDGDGDGDGDWGTLAIYFLATQFDPGSIVPVTFLILETSSLETSRYVRQVPAVGSPLPDLCHHPSI